MAGALVSFFGTPTVFAQTGIAQLSGCTGTDCSACNVVHLANGGIKWLIGILFVVFALLLAIAGVRLVTSGGNHHALDEAKSSFTNAIIGFLIILSAWLIVDTIMRALVGTDSRPGQLVSKGSATGYLFWSEISCQDQVDTKFETVKQEEVRYITEYQDETFSDAGYAISNPTGGQIPVGGGTVTSASGGNCPAASASSVVTISGTNYKARQNIASNFVAMRTAAARDGVTLTVTSGWRSEAVQLGIWNSPKRNCNVTGCRGTVARPCSLGGNGSNHNSGNAVDISMAGAGVNSPIFRWLKANGGKYGFYNNLGPNDPFHWSLSGR